MSLVEKLRDLVGPDDNIVAFNGPFSRKTLSASVYEQRQFFKPDGLWYSCGLGWLEFCEEASIRKDHVYVYRATFDKRRFKKISDPFELDRFSNEYLIGDPSWPTFARYKGYSVDWPRVASRHSGIEICPYIWQRRMDTDWYYPWDVASGCVWDTSCVKSVKLLYKP